VHARIVNGDAALQPHWTVELPNVVAVIGALKCRQAYLDGELCLYGPAAVSTDLRLFFNRAVIPVARGERLPTFVAIPAAAEQRRPIIR